MTIHTATRGTAARLTGAALFLFSLASIATAQEPKITSVKRTGNDVELKFIGTAGVLYTVQQSESLGINRPWQPADISATGTGAEQTLLVPDAGLLGKNFLRLAYTVAPAPAGYVRIPGGTFTMGDQSLPADGLAKELPAISVAVGEFFMKTTEVTKAEWDATATWATANGYAFRSGAGEGVGPSHPVTIVNWYDIVKWCNAKSEQEGLQAPYSVIVSGTPVIYRTGEPSKVIWAFTANGYRLPCEAEWEKAARGGLSGQRFPSGATINHSAANYRGTIGQYAYDTSGVNAHHPSYVGATTPYTSPVGSFPANGYGLHDMEANVREYCWDRVTSDWSGGYAVNPESATSLGPRTTRGGDWSNTAFTCRCSYRSDEFPDTGRKNYLGFRLVKGPLQ